MSETTPDRRRHEGARRGRAKELIDRALAEREAEDGYNKKNKITIVAWDGHLDRIWPTLILSTTAAASGMEVSVFFTFWGLFPLVKPERARKTGKDWMTKALGQMNPGSTQKAKLSRPELRRHGAVDARQGGRGLQDPHPTELLELARDMGVRLIPCQMTMDLMGVKQRGPDRRARGADRGRDRAARDEGERDPALHLSDREGRSRR